MKIIKGLIIIFAIILSTEFSFSQEVTINISDIRSAKGSISIMAFPDSATFKDKKPYKRFVIDKKNLKDGKITTKMTLPPGTYGISILDDENKNGKMDFNFIGYPQEGFGFSNYYHTGFSRPKFSSFIITVVENKDMSVDIKFRYL